MTDHELPANLTEEEVERARRWAEGIEANPKSWSLLTRTAARVILNAVPAPSPPTLADMAPEERAECQWMQADVKDYEITAGIIIKINPTDAHLIDSDGETWFLDLDTVTPRPDLPNMEWTGDKKPDPGPALPNGWRVADHKDNGRVIVANPTPSSDGRVYYVLPSSECMGFDWLFCDHSELTYIPQ